MQMRGFFAALRMTTDIFGLRGREPQRQLQKGVVAISVAYAYDFSDGGGVFDGFEEGMRYVGAGDVEAEAR